MLPAAQLPVPAIQVSLRDQRSVVGVKIPFRRELEFAYGEADVIGPAIRRVIANNPSPFTLHGTGTYILGSGEVAVIDPGPADPLSLIHISEPTRPY